MAFVMDVSNYSEDLTQEHIQICGGISEVSTLTVREGA